MCDTELRYLLQSAAGLPCNLFFFCMSHLWLPLAHDNPAFIAISHGTKLHFSSPSVHFIDRSL